jgi:hypothetical protein
MNLTKQFITLIFILVLPALIISSCKKGTNDIKANAIIIDTGDPAADGCGWLIKINSTDSTYSPKNLPVLYQIDSLKVHISYKRLTTRFGCGMSPGHGYYQIQLDAITKE